MTRKYAARLTGNGRKGMTMNDDAALTRRADAALDRAPSGPVDLARRAWLDAKRGRSGSERTADAYAATLDAFRAALRAAGLDLDGDTRAIALALQAWAGRDEPAAATFNQRRSIVSSFYAYAAQRGLLPPGNPADLVERRAVAEYRAARALDPATVQARLADIDRATPAGLRDYALLAVGLATGRRLVELAGLRWRNVTLAGEKVTLDFPRTKGGKAMRDALPPATGRALMRWLHAHYGARLGDLDPGAPLWPALTAGRGGKLGDALKPRQLQNICHERLQTHFHALRHTFARAMDASGAPVTATQNRLGHSSLATTSRYLAALRNDENPYGKDVEGLLLPPEG